MASGCEILCETLTMTSRDPVVFPQLHPRPYSTYKEQFQITLILKQFEITANIRTEFLSFFFFNVYGVASEFQQ